MKFLRVLSSILVLSLVSSGIWPQSAVAAISGDPTNIKAEAPPGTATAVVTWTAPAGATRYRIKAYIGAVAVKTSGELIAPRTSYTFSGLEYDIPYEIKVEAGDATSWRTAVGTTPQKVTPVAASPSAPASPKLASAGDKKLKAEWVAPSSSGGATIVSYSVQLKKSGTGGAWENVGQPVTTSNVLELTLTTPDSTTQFAVTVTAKNSAGKSSEASVESNLATAAVATILATPTTTSPPRPSSGNGGGGTNTTVAPAPNRGSNTPTTSPPSSGGDSNAATNTTVPTAAIEDQLTRIVSPVYAAPAISYTKTVSIKAKTTTKTLLGLSRLSVPKGSTTAYALSTTSKKYCSLKGTVVTAVKAGTCSITVTVKLKSGKKTSKTVKLVVKK
jgi:hypothetical protein